MNKALRWVRPAVRFTSPTTLGSKQSCLILGHHLNPTSPSYLILHTLLLLLLPCLSTYLHLLRAWDLSSTVRWALLIKLEVLEVLQRWGFGGFWLWVMKRCEPSWGSWGYGKIWAPGLGVIRSADHEPEFKLFNCSEKYFSGISNSLLLCWYFQIFHFPRSQWTHADSVAG